MVPVPATAAWLWTVRLASLRLCSLMGSVARMKQGSVMWIPGQCHMLLFQSFVCILWGQENESSSESSRQKVFPKCQAQPVCVHYRKSPGKELQMSLNILSTLRVAPTHCQVLLLLSRDKYTSFYQTIHTANMALEGERHRDRIHHHQVHTSH